MKDGKSVCCEAMINQEGGTTKYYVCSKCKKPCNVIGEDGLTSEKFIENFKKNTDWECEKGTRITNELTDFAKERLGSKRDIEELHVIFCMSKGIKSYK